MRAELGKAVEERGVYTGRYARYGTKKGQGRALSTICLRDLRNKDGQVVADHVWLNLTDGFKKLGMLLPGDILQFRARVKTYKKAGGKLDYQLSHPSQVRLV